jgi:hypothetical protein
MYILLNPNTDSSMSIPWIKWSFFKSGMGRHSLEVLCYVYHMLGLQGWGWGRGYTALFSGKGVENI